jgi:diguanylate cyclase (GGDEF)-like protein
MATDGEQPSPTWRDTSLPDRLTLVLVGALVSLAIVLHLQVLDAGPLDGPFALPWWALALGFVASEASVVHQYVRRGQSVTVSFSETPLLFGLALASPTALVLGNLVGSAVSLWRLRIAPLKIAFNVAEYYLSTIAAILAYRAVLGDASPGEPLGWLAAFTALAVVTLVDNFALAAVLFIHVGPAGAASVTERVRQAVTLAGSSGVIALVCLVIVLHNPWGVVLALVLLAMLRFAMRLYGVLQRRFEDLRSVYAFAERVTEGQHVDAVMLTTLQELRDELGVGFAAAVVLRPRRAAPDGLPTEPYALLLESNDEVRHLPLDQERLPAFISSLPAETSVVGGSSVTPLPLAAVDTCEHPGDGLDHGFVAALAVGGAVVGALAVGNRHGPLGALSEHDGDLVLALARHTAVTLERRRLIEELEAEAAQRGHEALHDALTGLPNRSLFLRSAQHALERQPRPRGHVAVLLVDLDEFKEVNDTLGHASGDHVLVELGARLTVHLDGVDLVARLGGDEFAVLLTRAPSLEDVLAVAERVHSILQEPIVHEGVELRVAGSIGVARSPEHGTDADTLLQRADVAMYAAKTGKTRHEIYSSDIDTFSSRRLALAAELRAAIDDHALQVVYQPKVCARTGRTIGVEALARWEHPRLGPISAGEFIPIADRTGLIRPLTMVVLRQALTDLVDVRRAGFPIALAVNLPPRMVLDVDLQQSVLDLLEETGADPSWLTLEITEDAMMAESARVNEVIHEIAACGVSFAIDDFGTGYSSLSYLQRLPVHEVKIDRSFVMNMASDADDEVIVRSTIDLVHSLGPKVCAEGVETERIQQMLADMGCDVLQGYHLSRPLALPHLMRWLEERERRLDGTAVDGGNRVRPLDGGPTRPALP